jgi:putative membrane protein insertion efficiency factor
MRRAGTIDRMKASSAAARAPRYAALGAVAIYRAAISPLIHAINGPACRFEPSCSAYARDAIAQHGIVRGGVMAIWRIARCNPVGGHGYDPVPRSGIAEPSPAGRVATACLSREITGEVGNGAPLASSSALSLSEERVRERFHAGGCDQARDVADAGVAPLPARSCSARRPLLGQREVIKKQQETRN